MSSKRPTPENPLKIGTRGSPLALAQAYETRRRLIEAFSLPEEALEIAIISTTGDRVQDRALSDIGGKGLFTLEIEQDLSSGAIDIAVHSMKDMPVDQPEGLVLDTYLPREDPRDAFVSLEMQGWDDLPKGAVVGTSSLRRKAQLLYKRPDLGVVEFRGNVHTRLKKLKEGVATATFLAMAGLNRLNLMTAPKTPIDPDVMLPAVAQGAIGIERRAEDKDIADLLAAIHDGPTGHRLAAERAFLAELDGSCQTPIAALAELQGTSLTLRGEILRPDGSECIAGQISGSIDDGAALGQALARDLLHRAGDGFFDWR